MLSITPSVQSPRAYDLNNLTGAVIAGRMSSDQVTARIVAAVTATTRDRMKSALQDSGFRYTLTPEEIAEGVVDADITFGYDPGDARRYGVIGDYLTVDDTAAIQFAIDICTLTKRTLEMGDLCCKISGQLEVTCPMRWNAVSYGDGGGGSVGPGYPGLLIDPGSSGYTAMHVVTQLATIENVTIIGNIGASPTVNGIHFDNGQRTTGRNLLVTGLDGFAVKIDRCWDCVFENISVLACGNATEYAVQVTASSGSTNECVFNRIQAERCRQKAVYVGPETYNCTFNVIHSEQAEFNGADYTHDLRGFTGIVMNSVRLTGHNAGFTAGAKVRFGFASGIVNNVSLETDGSGETGQLDISSTVAGSQQQFSNLLIRGNITVLTSNLARTIITNSGASGKFTVSDQADETVVQLFGCQMSMHLYGNGTRCTMHGCTISAYAVTGNSQLLKAYGCRLSLTELPAAAFLEAANCNFTDAFTFAVGGQSVLRARFCTFAGTPTLQGNGALLDVDGCTFNNGITLGGGTATWRFGASNRVTAGAVTAGLAAAPGGSAKGYVGERSFNIIPAAGQPKAWVCTVAGAPGTWVSEGNL